MFYQKNSVQVLNDLDSNLTGLTQEESKSRLEKYGRNQLQEKQKTPTWKLFLESFKDPLVIILLVAAMTQVFLGDTIESLIIFAVLGINAVLGVVQTKFGESFVLADIPGLIEGAAEGVGLGHDFLRHVERTKVLIHIVDISGLEGRDALDDFDKINGELKLYNEKLATRPQVVVANKMDILEDESIFEEFKNELEGRGYKVFKMSAATRQGVDDVIAYVSELLREAEEIELVSEEEMFRPELDEVQDEGLQIDIEDGVYVVTGKSLRRIMYSVNFDDMESLQYFQKAMESQGVFDRLREMGIEDGDTVRIYEIEFEFYN